MLSEDDVLLDMKSDHHHHHDQNGNVTVTNDLVEEVNTAKDGGPVVYEVGNSVEIREAYIGVRKCFTDLNQYIESQLNYLISKLKEDSIVQSEPQLQATPSKRNAGQKRPVPNSSSINKIIIHRSKRTATDNSEDTECSENNLSVQKKNTRAGARKLFTDCSKKVTTDLSTTKKRNNKKTAKPNDDPEQFIELMTELTINSNETGSTQQDRKNRIDSAAPFISQECSLAKQASSTVAANSTLNCTGRSTRATRYQTRQANSTINQTPKHSSSVNSSKQSKVKESTSMDRIADSNRNVKVSPKTTSVFNTPKRTAKATDAVSSVDPNLAPASRLPNTPTVIQLRRKELEQSKKLILMMSEEKTKKAIHNRDVILSSKQDALRSRQVERERKMELFKQKQLEKDRQNRDKLISKFCAPTVPAPVYPLSSQLAPSTTGTGHHNGCKLPGQALALQSSTRASTRSTRSKKPAQPQTPNSAMVKRQNSSSSLKSTNPKKESAALKKQNSASKLTAKNFTESGAQANATSKKLVDSVPKPDNYVELLTSDESSQMNEPAVGKLVSIYDGEPMAVDNCEANNGDGQFPSIKLSPIRKVDNGYGQLASVNTTFTTALLPGPVVGQPAPIQHYHHQAIVDSSLMSSTGHLLSSTVNNPNGTFTCPAPPAANPNGTFLLNKSLTKVQRQDMTHSLNNYPITPPPRRASVSTYDISVLVDSEEEDHNPDSNRKPIPRWAQGKPFLGAIKSQFSRSPTELRQIVKQIFTSRIVMPIPVEQMGLTVLDRYATRTSSVNWNDHNNMDQSFQWKIAH